MLKEDQRVFIGLDWPTSGLEYLPATLIETDGGRLVVSFERPLEPAAEKALTATQQVNLYFEHRNKFTQLAARVDAATSDDEKLTLCCTGMGEPVAVEKRACYRTVTLFEDGLTVTLNGRDACAVLDVSSTGCSVRSSRRYRIDETVSVAVEHAGRMCRGAARVRSIRQLGAKDYRYGLHCAMRTVSASNLRDGLQRISTSLQRQQLKRMAEAA